MNLKKLFFVLSGVKFVLIFALAGCSILLFVNQKDLNKSREIYNRSFLLADELRQSSDDLTRLARTYVATGNPEFEREYWEILDIRNGKSPRPQEYNRIYWDFVAVNGQKPRPDGKAESLHDLMVEVGLTAEEFAKLKEAQNNSNELVNTERIAMNAVKGLFDDGMGNFTVVGKPDREMAIRLMNDEKYHMSKASIMKPIDDFYGMLLDRTAKDVAKHLQHSTQLLWLLLSLTCVIMGMFWYSFSTIKLQITKRQEAEVALRHSIDLAQATHQQFERTVSMISDVVWRYEVDNQGRFIGSYISPAADRLLNLPTGSIGDSFECYLTYVHPEDLIVVRQTLADGIRSPQQSREIEYRMIKPDGTIIWVRSAGTAYVEASGSVVAFGSTSDISGHKRAEEALRESEERLRDIMFSGADWVWEVDQNGVYTYSSEKGAELFGLSDSDIIGKTPFDLMAPDDAKRVATAFSEIVANKKPIKDLENWNIKKDGQRICLLTNGVPILDKDGNLKGYRGVDKDITEIKHMQELASRAERLEMAGKIAGQVAHDFNNLLGPLVAYPDMIREELPKDHPVLTYIDNIEKASLQIAEINQQLLTLGRRGHYNLDVVNLNTILRQAIRDMGQLPSTVVCTLELAEELFNIRGGSAQLNRMISNMLNNACDAMSDIGQITIKTENYYVDDLTMVYGRVPKGEYVKLTISDTGCGITHDITQKIFDPFFTTKSADKKRGSGLGMSVVDAVVKDHSGYIDLSTKVGEGTSFYLYFPICRETIDALKTESTFVGNEKILIIDDDAMQREVSSRVLQRLGYVVTTAQSGYEALEILSITPYDLLVLDMIMPDSIDGTETYRRVLEINPSQRAIIVSGFSESSRVFEAQKLGVGDFVRKPLTRDSLAAAVRNELDRKVRIPVC